MSLPTSYASAPTPPNTPDKPPIPAVTPVAQEVIDMLPPPVLRIAIPVAMLIMGLSFLMSVGTICYRIIYITVHLDGTAAGLAATSGDISTLNNIIIACIVMFGVVMLGTQVAAKLLSLFGK